jgi:hypothetical protein
MADIRSLDVAREAARPRRSLRLTRAYRISIYGIGWGVWLTGVLWVIFHYFLRVKSTFGFRQNPLEEWWLISHGGFAVAATFLFGYLWRPHIVSGWYLHWRRWSGATLAGTTLFLVLSGYALYYIGGPIWLEWTAILHWAIGIAAIALFFIHWLAKSAAPER